MASQKTEVTILIKLNVHFPYNPATALLSIYHQEMKAYYVHKKICIPLFTAVLLITAKTKTNPHAHKRWPVK